MKIRRCAALLTAICLMGGLLTACNGKGDVRDPASSETRPTPVNRLDAIDPTSDKAGRPFYDVSELETVGSDAADAKEFDYFAFTTEHNLALPFNLACYIGDGELTAVLPAGVDRSALVADFSLSGARAVYNGADMVSGETKLDLNEPVTLSLEARDGSKQDVTLKVEALATGIPSVALTTIDYYAIDSRYSYRDCTVYVGGGDSRYCDYAAETPLLMTATAKGRGNSSWEQPKKGYTVKLAEKAKLLGMSNSKDWALVANYEDKSLIRNNVAMYLSETIGTSYVMQMRPVDFWYNGVYWGTYNLCEKVEIEGDRVNITKYDEATYTTPDSIGYLMEFDGHVAEVPHQQSDQWSTTGSYFYYDPFTEETFMPLGIGGKWLTLKKPSVTELKDEMADYVGEYISNISIALQTNDYAEIEKQLDVTSFARWYIVEELMNNTDSSMHSSVFMTLDAGGKLKLGPPWDFDRSSGNCDYWNTKDEIDSLYTSTAGWFYLLFQNPEARTILKQEWATFYQNISDLESVIRGYANTLAASQEYNFRRWNILNSKVGANPNAVVYANSYDKQVDLLVNYLTARVEKMNKFINGLH